MHWWLAAFRDPDDVLERLDLGPSTWRGVVYSALALAPTVLFLTLALAAHAATTIDTGMCLLGAPGCAPAGIVVLVLVALGAVPLFAVPWLAARGSDHDEPATAAWQGIVAGCLGALLAALVAPFDGTATVLVMGTGFAALVGLRAIDHREHVARIATVLLAAMLATAAPLDALAVALWLGLLPALVLADRLAAALPALDELARELLARGRARAAR